MDEIGEALGNGGNVWVSRILIGILAGLVGSYSTTWRSQPVTYGDVQSIVAEALTTAPYPYLPDRPKLERALVDIERHSDRLDRIEMLLNQIRVEIARRHGAIE